MQAHYDLATVLSQREWIISEVARCTVGVLTITSERFRKLVLLWIEDCDSATILTRLDFVAKSVMVKVELSKADGASGEPSLSSNETCDAEDENDNVSSGGSQAGNTTSPSKPQERNEDNNTSDQEVESQHRASGAEREMNLNKEDDASLNKRTEKDTSEYQASQNQSITSHEGSQDGSQDDGSTSQKRARPNGVELALPFDFSFAFPHIGVPEEAESWTFTDYTGDIIIAALEAINKCAYVSKPIESSHLISLIQRMTDVVYISLRPEGPQVHDEEQDHGKDSEGSGDGLSDVEPSIDSENILSDDDSSVSSDVSD